LRRRAGQAGKWTRSPTVARGCATPITERRSLPQAERARQLLAAKR
jgi:hypothetical protein